MNKYIYKALMYTSIAGIGVFHIMPYDITWTYVLYYICTYTALAITLFSVAHPIKTLDRYDKIENYILIMYFISKMGYHIANINKEILEYLYSLRSELWAGVYSIAVVGMLLSFQLINLIKYTGSQLINLIKRYVKKERISGIIRKIKRKISKFKQKKG